MAISAALLECLTVALDEAVAPCATWDFRRGQVVEHADIRALEAHIRTGLLSGEPAQVKDALANVVYFARAFEPSVQRHRVALFRKNVQREQIRRAIDVFATVEGNGVQAIHGIGLDHFGHMSFVTRVRSFLDPAHWVALDRGLTRLRSTPQHTPLHDITWYPIANLVPVNADNERCYVAWNHACCRLAAHESFAGRDVRPVEIERAIFHLVRKRELQLAARILAAAVA